jgi:hypothetical protein
MNDIDLLVMELNEQLWATKIDFKYNRKDKSYSVVRFNADPSMVLYKDGRVRVTTDEEIQRQFRKYYS